MANNKQKILLIAALLLPLPSFADKVIGVADGDTLTVLHAGKPLKIRLADIDAPEKKQAFGQVSKQSLSDMCFGKDATYQKRTVDRYGRIVARVTCAGVDVNREQVDKGLAWVYPRYNRDTNCSFAR
ncbi:MAG: thermonuclease family protein [Pseudomonadota bacterium]